MEFFVIIFCLAIIIVFIRLSFKPVLVIGFDVIKISAVIYAVLFWFVMFTLVEDMSLVEKLVIFDISNSMISLLGLIPIGRVVIVPRVPVLVALILMPIRKKIEKKHKIYCNVCDKTLDTSEYVGVCGYCDTEMPIKRINPFGKLRYYCSDKKCRCRSLYTLDGTEAIYAFHENGIVKFLTYISIIFIPVRWGMSWLLYGYMSSGYARTWFSSTSVLSRGNLNNLDIVCKNCGNIAYSKKVSSFTLYGESEELIKNYREVFLYKSLYDTNSTEKNIFKESQSYIVKAAKNHYETNDECIYLDDVKLTADNMKGTEVKLRVAIKDNSNFNLKISEGIILLLDGNSKSSERQSITDSLLLDMQNLGAFNGAWLNPVLVGVCANGVTDLEKIIDSGMKNAIEVEKVCKEFLIKENNSDLINSLEAYIKNVHFFIYRTGSRADGTENKIFNVEQPARKLILNDIGGAFRWLLS